MNPCMTCKYRRSTLTGSEYSKCVHPETQSPSGLELSFCITARGTSGPCGTAGRYWERRAPTFCERILLSVINW